MAALYLSTGGMTEHDLERRHSLLASTDFECAATG